MYFTTLTAEEFQQFTKENFSTTRNIQGIFNIET
ncbi:Uncharacterised protein [Staphylococcus carnosus]|uniref:Truncated putative FmhA protein (Fragment 1) n=1 Tax=Staphylococcus carnosus (strain TM300) TaxID=396513 RepID=B9DMC2_STACT|nr:truncated putative FmhA protein (fragment 1) [Staphylococcus carnosus subsp. carnosus TM300]SUL90002.1 Uncharacterised protein [Staphylococcus carnosus]